MSSIPPSPNQSDPTIPGERPHAPPTDEEVVYYDGPPFLGGQPEKVILLALAGVVFLISPVLFKFAHKNHEWPGMVPTLVVVVIAIVFWIIPVVITKSIKYRITNYRIDFERGLISKDISTLELWHVEDIAFHQSILDRSLGIGSIRVISHDDSMPDLRMRGLPDARKLFEELKQRIIAVKRQTGVLKVDTGT